MAFNKGWIDIHAHILPGIDDGAKDWNESVRLLKMAYRQGVRHIIATPHFSLSQDLALLRDIYERLDQKAWAISENYHISLGQEIMYSENLLEYLETEKALTLAGSRYVLIEFGLNDSMNKMERAVRQIVQASYFPIIAHVERYKCLEREGSAEELTKYGAYLQINAGSLNHGWMDKRTRWCKKNLKKGTIHFLASDMHNTVSRPPEIRAAIACMEQWAGEELAIQIARENPGFILADKML